MGLGCGATINLPSEGKSYGLKSNVMVNESLQEHVNHALADMHLNAIAGIPTSHAFMPKSNCFPWVYDELYGICLRHWSG